MTLPQVSEKPSLPPFHVVCEFGPGIPGDVQGRALLAMEQFIRIELRCPAEVYKHTMADDLKRRRDMTAEDRKRL